MVRCCRRLFVPAPRADLSCWWIFGMLALLLTIIQPAEAAVQLDCDPCIDRNQYTLKAVLHGTSDSDFWLQAQAAMRQAALDMGVHLDLELKKTFNSFQMAQEIATAAKNPNYDALIVTIPDSLVQEAVAVAIQEERIPVFGMNLGYEVGQQIGVLGFVAQDEFVAGEAAAQEFLRITNVTKALFVQNDQDPGLEERYRGFREVLAPVDFSPADGETDRISRQVSRIFVDPTSQFEHVTALQSVFQNNCEYDVVLLGSVASLDVAVAALESNGCLGQTILGSFDETPELNAEISNGRVAFGVSQQSYLQAVLPVYFAAIYMTTGKALALPVEERVYLSGPTIFNSENVPTDTLQECADDAFPVCPNTMAPNGDPATCQCTDRSKIRIGGVLHGVTTDSFWDPVFASAEQAATSMGVDLDLIRFKPSNDDEDIFRQMAARIRALCDGGVDGIFVSIPSDIVVDSIRRCQELQVPVISVNAGGGTSQELGLLNHIGMLEYSAGFGAAARLLEAGMERAYCLDHAPGNIVTAQRCLGFADAIAGFDGGIAYMGRVEVPLDNKVQYQKIVQEAVDEVGDWKGIGILLLGASQIEPYQETLADFHPGAIVGSFDLNSDLYTGLQRGIFRFGIDQQPFLQGNMPVILLALEAYTKQSLKNHVVETGPNFVEAAPSKAQEICEANFYSFCPDRPPEDMNFISDGLNVFGEVLFGLLVLVAALAGAWTFYYREKWVVKISQPFYLYLMLGGVLLSSLSILLLGVETEYRTLQDPATGELTDVENPDVSRADVACMLVPWFYGLGFAVTFSAIFAKIQRVKLIYLAGISMQRKKVTFKDVMNIMIVMLGIEFGLLLSWQLVSPYRWERTVTQTEDDFPVESLGVCTSDSGSYFFLSIVLFHVFCLIFALVLAWQTKDINSEFAESSYLFLTVMFMFQVQCLAIPILALVQDSPEAFYFVQAIAIFCQNCTVVVLIFGPKMYRVFIGQADLTTGGGATGTTAPGRIITNHRMSLTRVSFDNDPARRTSLMSMNGTRPYNFDAEGRGDGDSGSQIFTTDPFGSTRSDRSDPFTSSNRSGGDADTTPSIPQRVSSEFLNASSDQFQVSSPPGDGRVNNATNLTHQQSLDIWVKKSDKTVSSLDLGTNSNGGTPSTTDVISTTGSHRRHPSQVSSTASRVTETISEEPEQEMDEEQQEANDSTTKEEEEEKAVATPLEEPASTPTSSTVNDDHPDGMLRATNAADDIE